MFDDEKKKFCFLNHLDEFENFQACSKEEGFDFKGKDVTYSTFGDMVVVEQIFDKNDGTKRIDDKKMDPDDFVEVNIGFPKNQKFVKIGKGTSKEEKENMIDFLIEYHDVLDFWKRKFFGNLIELKLLHKLSTRACKLMKCMCINCARIIY